jgi:hypothetical protein
MLRAVIPALIVDDESTWPTDLRELFASNLGTLRAFEVEEDRIQDLKYKKGWETRWPPPNPHRQVHDLVIDRATELASNLFFAAYHCTRLHAEEADAILRSGMVPLSWEHFEQRLRARTDAGDIPAALGATLRAQNYVNDVDSGWRLNRTCFVLSSGTAERCLDYESGIDHFFRFWGGESLYKQHMDHETIAPLLRSVGAARIVEVALRIEQLSEYPSLGERLLNGFLNKLGDSRPGWEEHVSQPIPATQVRRIIERSDPLFESLTGCSGWDEPLA